MQEDVLRIYHKLQPLFRAHPWHGVPLGTNYPEIVTAYIEVGPADSVKYELDKASGILKVDRPQLYSNICPTLYGMLPRTYSGKRVAEYCNRKTGRNDIAGDDDPLDICVLTEKYFPHGDILLQARPIGGIRMIDNGEADDKIIAVMKGDAIYGSWQDISDCPDSILKRIEHYFLTYKMAPDETSPKTEIVAIYGKEEAHQIIQLGVEDYKEKFPHLADIF